MSDYDHRLSFVDLLVDRSMAVVDADAGGVLSDGNGKLEPLVSSDETTRMLELFGLQSDEGPCIESYRRNQQVVDNDARPPTRAESRREVRAPHLRPRS